MINYFDYDYCPTQRDRRGKVKKQDQVIAFARRDSTRVVCPWEPNPPALRGGFASEKEFDLRRNGPGCNLVFLHRHEVVSMSFGRQTAVG